MKLQHLIEAIGPCTVKGPADKEITSLTADSRKAAAGGMFVAVRGVTVDGHTFIPSLAGSGVAAYVVETLPDTSSRKPHTSSPTTPHAPWATSPRAGTATPPRNSAWWA